MKHMFRIFGILVLVMGSFVYTDKVSMTAKSTDELLNEIRTKSINYKLEPVEPIIYENTIIPGVIGREVDINKSYKKMREIGYFDEKLLVYKKIKLEYPLDNNLDKFIISGNQDKKSVALIFKVNNNTKLDNIIKILNNDNIKGSFFITSSFFEQNNELVLSLLNENHTIGNLSNNGDYNSSDFVWLKTVITNVGKQRNYCYTEEKDVNILDICKTHSSRTVVPTKVVKNYPLTSVKKNLESGAIFSFEINTKTNNELKSIINYIKSRGFNIESLEQLLSE